MSASSTRRGYTEPFHVKWGRRAVTIPGYLIAALMLLSFTPLLMPVAVVFDVVRRDRFASVRSLLMVDVYLLAEALGVLASLGIWATSSGWRREASRDHYLGGDRCHRGARTFSVSLEPL